MARGRPRYRAFPERSFRWPFSCLPAYWAKQVIDKGEESLSPKQKFVFQQNVLDEFATAECRRDGGSIPWSEMYLAYQNGGYCSYCAYMMDKVQNE